MADADAGVRRRRGPVDARLDRRRRSSPRSRSWRARSPAERADRDRDRSGCRAEAQDAAALQQAVAALAHWNDDASRPLLVWEGLPDGRVPPCPTIPPLRPAFVAGAPRACCLGAGAGARRRGGEPAATRGQLVQLRATPRPSVAWTATADACTAHAAAGGSDPHRQLWLVDGERLRALHAPTPATSRRRDRPGQGRAQSSLRRPRAAPACWTTSPKACGACSPMRPAIRARTARAAGGASGSSREPPFAREEAWIAGHIAGLRGRVLDVGCGEQLYRDELGPLRALGHRALHRPRSRRARAWSGSRAALPRGSLPSRRHRGLPRRAGELRPHPVPALVEPRRRPRRGAGAHGRAAHAGRIAADRREHARSPCCAAPEQVAAADRAPRAGHQHFRNVASEDVLPFARRRGLRVLQHHPASLRDDQRVDPAPRALPAVSGSRQTGRARRRRAALAAFRAAHRTVRPPRLPFPVRAPRRTRPTRARLPPSRLSAETRARHDDIRDDIRLDRRSDALVASKGLWLMAKRRQEHGYGRSLHGPMLRGDLSAWYGWWPERFERRCGACRMASGARPAWPPRLAGDAAALRALRLLSGELPVLPVLPRRAARPRAGEPLRGPPGGDPRPLPAALGRVDVSNAYFGGGTPSALTAPQLGRFVAAFEQTFRVKNEFTCEGHPGDLDEEKLALLARAGVNRLSMGVQSLDPGVCRRIGRMNPPLAAHRRAGAPRARLGMWVNPDLVLGLPEQTPESFLSDLDRMLAVGRPDCLTVYRYQPVPHLDDAPDETMRYSRVLTAPVLLRALRKGYLPATSGDDDRPGKDFLRNSPRTWRQWIDRLRYEVIRVVRADSELRSYAQFENNDSHILGIGPGAMSHIYGHSWYRDVTAVADLSETSEPVYLGTRVTPEDECRSALLQAFAESRWIDPGALTRRSGVDIDATFGAVLDAGRRSGALRRAGRWYASAPGASPEHPPVVLRRAAAGPDAGRSGTRAAGASRRARCAPTQRSSASSSPPATISRSTTAGTAGRRRAQGTLGRSAPRLGAADRTRHPGAEVRRCGHRSHRRRRGALSRAPRTRTGAAGHRPAGGRPTELHARRTVCHLLRRTRRRVAGARRGTVPARSVRPDPRRARVQRRDPVIRDAGRGSLVTHRRADCARPGRARRCRAALPVARAAHLEGSPSPSAAVRSG